MSNIFTGRFPSGLHIYAKGQEPLPPGLSDDDRPAYEQNKKWERYMVTAMESCPAKTVMAGAAGTPYLMLWLTCLVGIAHQHFTPVRTGHWRFLFTHVCVFCVRRSSTAAANSSKVLGTASTRRLQRDGKRNVVDGKGFWKSWRTICGYRVRDRVGT